MDEETRTICGAGLRKKPGQFCRVRKGLARNGRCYLHGGTSPRGVASPAYRHGARARYLNLPARMKRDYATALSDPALLELKHEIALLHARTCDLLARVDTGESGHLWQLLQQAYTTLTSAHEEAERDAAIAEMGQLIQRGAADYAAWSHLLKTIEQKQKLVESERKRAVELHQTITLDQLNPLLYAIIDFVRRKIPDRAGLMEFQRILETHAGIEDEVEEPQGTGPKRLLH